MFVHAALISFVFIRLLDELAFRVGVGHGVLTACAWRFPITWPTSVLFRWNPNLHASVFRPDFIFQCQKFVAQLR
jgi:hypothetical protein